MKKTWLVYLMALGLVLSMAAPSVYDAEDHEPDGSLVIGEDVEPQGDAQSRRTEEEYTEMPGRTTPGPETVDVGDFIVDVSEGWLGVREPMGIWDKDASDEFFPDSYSLVKGGQTPQDIKIGSPVVDIYYCNDSSVMTPAPNLLWR